MIRVILLGVVAAGVTACSDSGAQKGHAGGQSSTGLITGTISTNASSPNTNQSVAVESGQNSVNASEGTGNQK